MGLKNVKYRIVVAEDTSDLAIHVNEWIVAGWKCQGGVAYYPGWVEPPTADGANFIEGSFMQAMVKAE